MLVFSAHRVSGVAGGDLHASVYAETSFPVLMPADKVEGMLSSDLTQAVFYSHKVFNRFL